MVQLSAPARRFVDRAVTTHVAREDQDAWASWIGYSDTEFPMHIADIAIRALDGMAKDIERSLDEGSLDSKSAAQLENDLGYIEDIEAFFTESAYELKVNYS